MLKIIKIEDLPKRLQTQIIEASEFKAAGNYFCEDDEMPIANQLEAIKAVAKVNPALQADEISCPVEDYNCHTVGHLLEEIEMSKMTYIRHALWAISLVKAR